MIGLNQLSGFLPLRVRFSTVVPGASRSTRSEPRSVACSPGRELLVEFGASIAVPIDVGYVPARKQSVWPARSLVTAAFEVRSGASTVPGLESEPFGSTTRLQALGLSAFPACRSMPGAAAATPVNARKAVAAEVAM